MESEIVETSLGQIEFTKVGSGQPIIFIHGGHSNCHETLFQKGYDTRNFQLITPSRPGYGRTSIENNEQPKEAAQLISQLIQKLDLKKVIIVGISAGGLTAIEFAAQLNEEVSKLILISAVTKRWLTPKDELYRKGKKMFSPTREKFSWSMFRFFFRLFPRMMTKVLFKEISTAQAHTFTKEEINEVKEMTFKQRSGNGFVTDLDHEIDIDVITQINCPTLILHSTNDKTVSIDMAEHANEKISNSTLKTFENKWGHLLWIGAESQSPIQEVNKFIRKTS